MIPHHLSRITPKISFTAWSLWALLALLCSTTVAQAAPGDCGPADIEALRQVKARTVEWLRGGEVAGDQRMQASRALSRQTAEYLAAPFEPIVRIEEDPQQTTRNTGERAGELRRLAQAYTDVHGEFYKNPDLMERIVKGLDDLLPMYKSRAAKEGNWHTWLISVPSNIGPMALMLEGDLPADRYQGIINTMAGRLEEMVLGGANASWEARNHAYLALLTEDCARLAKAAERVFVDVRYGSTGVREDYSYLFHGKIPYAGGYGSGLAQTVGQFAYLFQGTQWALEEAKAELVSRFLLEHARWFVVGPRMGLHVRGRSYERPGGASSIVEAMLFLAHAGVEQRQELLQAAKSLLQGGVRVDADLASWADELMESQSPATDALGFRYWPESEIGAFRTNKFHIGFRQYSRRVQDYEYINRQGAEGWNLAMGFTNILRRDGSGDWYMPHSGLSQDIDMEALTSVTFRHGANPDNTGLGNFYGYGYSLNFGTSPFAGGAGWGDSGVAGFILAPPYGGIEARKSLHFFKDGYWALGSGIRSIKQEPSDAGTVRTAIIQWPTGSTSPTITLSDGKTVHAPEQPRQLAGVEWLWFSNIGVVFTGPTDVMCVREGDVVRLWLDHGQEPSGVHYSYAVLPTASLQETRQFAASPSVSPVRNDLAVHAVGDSGGRNLSAVFFEAGEVGDIAADQPMIFHRSPSGDGEVVTIQNPLQDNSVLQFKAQLAGQASFKDTELLIDAVPGGKPARIFAPTIAGRLYRFASGEPATQVTSVPRTDLDHLRQFKVTAQSSADETILTVRMPPNWMEQPFSLNIGGRQGHPVKDLTAGDLVNVLPGGIFIYRWDRELTEEQRQLPPVRQQRNGDFRLHYNAPMEAAVDYFHVPYYNESGEQVEPPADYLPDADSPYRKK